MLAGHQSLSKEDLAMSGIVIRVFEAAAPTPSGERTAANESFVADPKEKVINEVLVKGQDTLHTVG